MQQKSKVIERSNLFNAILARNLSDRMFDLTSKRIEKFDPYNHEAREAEAKKITEIIDSSTTEAEMLEKLAKL